MTDTRPLSVPAGSAFAIDIREPGPARGDTSIAPAIQARPLFTDSPAGQRAASNDTSVSNPCLSCGACCAHFRVSFYCGEIAGEGAGTVPPELVAQVGPLRGCMKGTEYGGRRCIALRGELGREGIHCAIYEQRPSPCRDFQAWLEDGSPNPDCQRLRKAIGLQPLPPRTDDDLHPRNNPPRRGDVAA